VLFQVSIYSAGESAPPEARPGILAQVPAARVRQS
jgi:hypothetical protein